MHNIRYLDLHGLFLNKDGTCNDNMRGDRIHISSKGQQAWMLALSPLVELHLDH